MNIPPKEIFNNESWSKDFRKKMEAYSERVLKVKGEKTMCRTFNKDNSTKNNHIGLGCHEKKCLLFLSIYLLLH